MFLNTKTVFPIIVSLVMLVELLKLPYMESPKEDGPKNQQSMYTNSSRISMLMLKLKD